GGRALPERGMAAHRGLAPLLKKPMTTARNGMTLNRGWRGPRDRREGHRQRKIRRLLIAADGQPVSTLAMMEAIYPYGPWPYWRWHNARMSARRYAKPVLSPRSRPLLWRAKPGVLRRGESI